MRWIGILGAVFVMLTTMTASGQATSRDLLAKMDDWKTLASDGVKIAMTPDNGAMRIDFDFTAGAGYGGVYLDLPIELPENYELAFNLRGQGPANNLELKLVDPDKLNVWWVNRRAYEWPAEFVRLSNRRRHFQFAWGPSGGAPLKQLGRIELIIAANEGGRGSVWIDDFQFRSLEPEKPYTGTPTVSASSNAAAAATLLGGKPGSWTAANDDARPWLDIDFGQSRDIGGMIVRWPARRAGGDFDVETSDDGSQWTLVRQVRGATALPSQIMLTDLATRHLRLRFASASPQVASLEILETADGASPNAFWQARASRARRGIYPRSLCKEQSFWTVIGRPDDEREALINEEGQIEVDRRGFSVEPLLVNDGRLLTWADGKHQQSLYDGWAPIPQVIRRHEGLELSITALATAADDGTALDVRYELRNTGTARTRGQLVLAIRPIQVLPPWQDLNIAGGWSPIRSIRAVADGVIVNGSQHILADGGFSAAAATDDNGDVVAMLDAGVWPNAGAVECPQRSASALIHWDYDLEPGATAAHVIAIPFGRQDGVLPASFDAAVAENVKDWSARVSATTVRLPGSARQFSDTLRATQAYILINHDGNGFQPGSRTYNRSWIRDGSMTSAAMLELGHAELVRRFIDWYAPYQFPSGKVPCVVDRRGADPVPEHDSNGQLIWLIANFHRFTGDSELVRRHFSRVRATVEYIQSLRAERLTDEYGAKGPPHSEPGKPPVPALAFRGLVPASISHEGYSAKPMHSFWDTFYILRGLKDAAYLAEVAGDAQLAARWKQLADEFRQDLINSIRLTQEAHGIDYLPGCVELGDFDSTSSTILLWPVDEGGRFPRPWIDATFDRAWSEFTRRRDQSPPTWDAYTPYELRHVGAYVRLGHKDRAWAAMQWFLKYQRPQGWREWAEVVWREPTTPRMIGDMPHTWCGSDFLNAACAMFAYTDQAAGRLVLFAGCPDEWFADPEGVAFENLCTEFGTLSAASKPTGPTGLIIEISGAAKPSGGFDLPSPLSRPVRSATVNGQPVQIDQNTVHIAALPASIHLGY